MLRTGRIGGEQWAELLREGEGKRWPETELVAHGYAGAAQLRVVCMMALQDAAFAVVAGRVDDCERLTVSQPFAPVAVGEAPGRLLQEAARKLAAVAALPYPVRPDRERPAPIPGSDLRCLRLSAAQRELLAHADGRRTARDIAFATGRAVYTVTVGMARLIGEGLLESTDGTGPSAPITVHLPPTGALQRRPPAAPRPADRGTGPAGEPPGADGAEGRSLSKREAEERQEIAEPREPAEPKEVPEESVIRPVGQTPRLAPEVILALASAVGAGVGAATAAAGAAKGADATLTRRSEAEAPATARSEAPAIARSDAPATSPRPTPSELPRRKPGASGITETLAPEKAGASWKGFFRLRNRIWTPDSGT